MGDDAHEAVALGEAGEDPDVGYFLGNLAPEEKEDAQMKPAVQELYQWFRQKTEEEFGAFYCKDITHLDWGIIMEKCPGLIADTYTKVMEILTERQFCV